MARPARIRSFAPVADARARVLILGSIPGSASLAAGHYYAHPRNQFWRLLAAVFDEPLGDLDWEARYAALRARGIALWDVIEHCEREGSLDAAIRDPSANDLAGLLARLPALEVVLFNGRTAARAAAMVAAAGYRTVVLPSSSPAHAGMRYEDKLAQWRVALTLPQRRAPRHRPVEVPIVLSEIEGVRYLHFGTPWVQGAMLIRNPDVLVLDYVQRMMAWLLFLRAQADILQLGLGAGSLTRFCRRRLDGARIDVVEASRDVIDAARACFALPPNDDRLRVVCADASAFVARPVRAARYDVVQVDLYDAEARGPTCDSLDFYRDCRRVLREPGVCVVNLFGRHRSHRSNLARLRKAFDGRVLELAVDGAGNRIVLAFVGPPLRVDWSLLRQRAQVLEARLGLAAPRWVDAFAREHGGEGLER